MSAVWAIAPVRGDQTGAMGLLIKWAV